MEIARESAKSSMSDIPPDVHTGCNLDQDGKYEIIIIYDLKTGKSRNVNFSATQKLILSGHQLF